MKRFLNLNFYLSMMLMASLFLVTSCGEDPVEPGLDLPGLELDGDLPETIEAGQTISLTVNGVAPEGFNRLLITREVGTQAPVTVIDSARASGTTPTTVSYLLTYTPTVEDAGEVVVFNFLLVDDEGQEATETYTVTVDEIQVVTYNTVLLSAPTEDQSNQVWFSVSTGERYSTEEVNSTTDPISSEIDFGYRYGPSAGATLASPVAYPSEGGQNTSGWGTLNETMLRRVESGVSETEFLEMGNSGESLVAAYEAGTAGADPQRLAGLQEGDVLAFLTDPDKAGGNRYGLIHVEEINLGADGTGFGSDAFISLNVKVQGEATE